MGLSAVNAQYSLSGESVESGRGSGGPDIMQPMGKSSKQTVPQPKRSVARSIAALVLVALGVMSLCYGISVFMLGTGSTFFLFWFVVGALLIFWAVALLWGWTAKVPRWLKAAFATFCVALATVSGVAYSAIMDHIDEEAPAGVDYLIVLGVQVTESGPSAVLRMRLNMAVDYLDANPDTIVIVTGCQGPNEPWAEAYGMRDYLIALGIAPERIIVEDQARDTAENIAYSAAYIPEGSSIAIVSNNFHIYRALAIAKKQGVEAYGMAAPMAPFYFLNNVTREVIAIICYKILGRI